MSTPFVGEIRLFGFPRIPTGWLACNGQLMPIQDYEPLFSLIGTTYGGNGQTNFALPDLRGRLPVHQGTGNGLTPKVIGQVYGTESVTLTTGQIPSHSHALIASQNAATQTTPTSTSLFGNVSPDVWYFTTQGSAQIDTLNPSTVGLTGQNLPHDNCMPTLTASYCIAFVGIFPTQS